MSDELRTTRAHFSTLLISDIFIFCSFLLSHPLYLSYFIFFSPYLLKLVSFLSPLFATTFLVLLAGIVHEGLSAHDSHVLEILRVEEDYGDEGSQGLDDLGMYEILFGTCSTNCLNESPEKKPEESPESGSEKKDCTSLGKKIEDFEAKMLGKNAGPVSEPKNPCPAMEERRLENFLKILDQFEKMSTAKVEEKKKKIEPLRPAVPKIDKIAVASEGVCNNAATKISVNISSDRKEQAPMVKAHSQRISSIDGEENERDFKKFESFRSWDHGSHNSSNNNLSFGSMRKEKEWKRTLACKLFEERHNVGGGEGMDSLWEAYEMGSTNKPPPVKQESVKKKRSKKTSEIELSEALDRTNKAEDEEEEEVVVGQLCCLQAIKLSAGKMSLGMGKPNLVKISKAIKGFGWLHHVSKHSKKVHNNNGDR